MTRHRRRHPLLRPLLAVAGYLAIVAAIAVALRWADSTLVDVALALVLAAWFASGIRSAVRLYRGTLTPEEQRAEAFTFGTGCAVAMLYQLLQVAG
jgi:hypothetical protein